MLVFLGCYVKSFCSCQTYEGGIAGEPGSEAHGGYVSSDDCIWKSFLSSMPSLAFVAKHNLLLLSTVTHFVAWLQ